MVSNNRKFVVAQIRPVEVIPGKKMFRIHSVKIFTSAINAAVSLVEDAVFFPDAEFVVSTRVRRTLIEAIGREVARLGECGYYAMAGRFGRKLDALVGKSFFLSVGDPDNDSAETIEFFATTKDEDAFWAAEPHIQRAL